MIINIIYQYYLLNEDTYKNIKEKTDFCLMNSK